jgi:hypothetical protein
MPAGAALPGQITMILDSLKGTLGGVTDEASAKTALPKLQDVLGKLNGVKASAAALPAEARGPLATIASGLMPSLAPLIDKALAIPGVAAVLKPILEQITASLGGIGK